MATQFYKHPQYGNVYGDAVVTPTGRCAWPALVKPQDPPPAKPGEKQGAPRYGITIILPKNDKGIETWIKAIASMIKDMLVLFNQGRKAKLSVDNVVLDGDAFNLEKYPYYKDSWLLIARNVNCPPVVDGKKSELPVDSIAGGMFVRATITPMLTGSGVSYKLNAVQRVKDDNVRFGGGGNRAGSYVNMIPDVDEAAETYSGEEATETEAAVVNAKSSKKGKAQALAML